MNYFHQTFSDFNTNFDLASAGLNLYDGFNLAGAPNIQITGFDEIGLTPPEGREDITGHLTDVVSYTTGKHQFRFGGEFRRAQLEEFYHRHALGSIFVRRLARSMGRRHRRHRQQRARARRLPRGRRQPLEHRYRRSSSTRLRENLRALRARCLAGQPEAQRQLRFALGLRRPARQRQERPVGVRSQQGWPRLPRRGHRQRLSRRTSTTSRRESASPTRSAREAISSCAAASASTSTRRT